MRRFFPIIRCLKDFLVLKLFPTVIIKKMMGEKKFVFLIHPLIVDDWDGIFPNFKKVTNNLKLKFGKLCFPLIGGSICFCNSLGKAIKGWVMICPLTTEQILESPELAKNKILQVIRFSEKLGVKYVGLGGYTSIITLHGKYLVDKKIKVHLTAGNVFSTVLIVKNFLRILELLELKIEEVLVAIVGCGSVGSACAKILLEQGAKNLLLVDRDNKKIEVLSAEVESTILNNSEIKIKFSNSLTELKKADVLITVTNSAEKLVTLSMVSKGTVIIDGAYPSNINVEVEADRDILVIKSGIARVPHLECDIDIFNRQNEVYSCLGEVLFQVWKGEETNYSIGDVNLSLVREMMLTSEKADLYLGDFRGLTRSINKEDIERIKAIKKVGRNEFIGNHV